MWLNLQRKKTPLKSLCKVTIVLHECHFKLSFLFFSKTCGQVKLFFKLLYQCDNSHSIHTTLWLFFNQIACHILWFWSCNWLPGQLRRHARSRLWRQHARCRWLRRHARCRWQRQDARCRWRRHQHARCRWLRRRVRCRRVRCRRLGWHLGWLCTRQATNRRQHMLDYF